MKSLVLALVSLSLVGWFTSSPAATLTVSTLADGGAGSLRQAIAEAGPGDTVDFGVTGTIALTSGELVVDKALSILGPGATQLAVSGSDSQRVFNVTAGPTSISGLTVAHGYSSNDGLDRGAAILNFAHLTVSGCVLSDNFSRYYGGAIYNSGGGTLTLLSCLLANNRTGDNDNGYGGGIMTGDSLQLTNCTFSGNRAGHRGGALYSSAAVSLQNCTVTRNGTLGCGGGCAGEGGGIANAEADGGALEMHNSIVAGNTNSTGAAHDLWGTVGAGDYNLVQYTNGLTIAGTHNVLGADPLLGLLTDNGGPTPTCGLQSQSPAVDAGDGTGAPLEDQRGVGRPVGGGYDIGAFEGALPNASPRVANSIVNQAGTYGVAFNFTFAADTFVDPDAGDSLAYAASGLPPGLSFDPITRSFSGTPLQSGTFTITVAATDNGLPELSIEDVFDLVVASANLLVSADHKSRPIGQPNPPLTGALSGVVNNDNITVTFTTIANSASPPGPYPITPEFADPDSRLSNYTVTTNLAILTVEAPVYEGFAYPGGPLNGRNGGTGFSAEWTGSSSFGITPVTFSRGGPTTGASLGGEGTISRPLLEPIGTPGTTRYLSALVLIVFGGGVPPPQRFGLQLTGPASPGLFVGRPDSGTFSWVLDNAAGGSPVAGPALAGPQPYQLVVKCEFFAGNDRFTLYVNPTPGQPEPVTGAVKFNSDVGTITHVAFTAAGTFAQIIFDELRLTSSYEAALPACSIVTVSPGNLPGGELAVNYSQTLDASGGTAPYAFSVVGGSLPSGLTLAANGLLSGTPTSSGNFSFTVRAADAIGCGKSQAYTLNIPCAAIAVSPGTLAAGPAGAFYEQVLTASGGTGPYSFIVTGGAPPPGLALSGAGTLSGVPTVAGSYSFTVQATDTANCSGSTSCALAIFPPTVHAATGLMNTNRSAHTATLLPTGQVLACGGVDGAFNSLANAELYDPATGHWQEVSPLQTARSRHTATLLPNGKALVVGGIDANSSFLRSAELYDPIHGTWTGAGALNRGRVNHTATLLPNGKVLVVGGDAAGTGVELYDFSTDTWEVTGALATGRHLHTATLLPNGKVLVAGGADGGQVVGSAELYDPATGTWTTTGALNSERGNHRATLLPNGKVLVAGGQGSGAGYLASAELYDVAAGTWTPTAAMGAARATHASILLPNGKLLVAGGVGADFIALSSVEAYDPGTGTWIQNSPLAHAREGHTASLLPNGQVLLAGGADQDGGVLASAELLEFASGTWTGTGAMSAVRANHTGLLLPNGKVLVAGGLGNALLGTAQLYDPVTGVWTATGVMNRSRQDHSATLLPNGKVLVAGGFGSSQAPLANAELYDPAAGTWTATGTMLTPRWFHSATLLANGKVLVVGSRASDFPAKVDLYDPGTGQFTPTGSLNTGRYFHTATLLADGKVLVTSGRSDTSGALSSAELYDPATGTWTLTGPLSIAREHATATLLPNGKVLVSGGSNVTIGDVSSSELYDPASGTWSATGPLTVGRYAHTATLLANGKVMVAGGASGQSSTSLPSAELYDPVTGTWTATGLLTAARYSHTATLLLNGRVLVAGGHGAGNTLGSTEYYDVGLGFIAAWQPQPTTLASPLPLGRSLVLTGSRFRGVSEGSGGNAQASPGDYPLVQLRSVESGRIVFVPSTSWSATSFTSAPVPQLPLGWTFATVFVNGIPGAARLLRLDPAPVPSAILLMNPAALPDGSFQFGFTNTSGVAFTVLASTNVGLPLNDWTVLGPVTEISPRQFQFTDPPAPGRPHRFYKVRSP